MLKSIIKYTFYIIISFVIIGISIIIFVASTRLPNYDVPIETYEIGYIVSDIRDGGPDGFETRQFATCIFIMLCTYEGILEDELIIFRNNNKPWDKKFANVKAVNKNTYTIEFVDETHNRITQEIPKKWVFGKD